jgi:hypothetical protein
MTGVTNSSSVYFMAVHSGTPTFSGVLIFILVTMGYAVYVTLWALFQMQFAGMMHLVPHRTSAVCLSFNARMCARLAAPMAFFYLGVLFAGFLLQGLDAKGCKLLMIRIILHSSCLSCSDLFVNSQHVVCCPVQCLSSLWFRPLLSSPDNSFPFPPYPISPFFSSRSFPIRVLVVFALGWLAESGIKSGDWLYRPEPPTEGFYNVTSIVGNSTINNLEPYTINNDILMRSAFSHFYQMDKIGIFRQFFATLFPILLIIVMFLVTTNVLNYILVKCKLDYMQMGTCKNSIYLELSRQITLQLSFIVFFSSLTCNCFLFST